MAWIENTWELGDATVSHPGLESLDLRQDTGKGTESIQFSNEKHN